VAIGFLHRCTFIELLSAKAKRLLLYYELIFILFLLQAAMSILVRHVVRYK